MKFVLNKAHVFGENTTEYKTFETELAADAYGTAVREKAQENGEEVV